MPSEENSTSNVLRQFFVNYLGNRKTLETKIYSSADEIIREAFSVYDKAEFNNGNAVVTYFDFRGEEKLLENVPEYAELFIRHVRHNSPSFFLLRLSTFSFLFRFIRRVRCAPVRSEFSMLNSFSNVQKKRVANNIVTIVFRRCNRMSTNIFSLV